MSEAATPWPGMLQTAVRMGVTPEVFWRLSLREWRLLTTAATSADAPMGRVEFERLAEIWPDNPPPTGEAAGRVLAL